MSEMLLGAAAGCVATVPMTAVMEALYRSLPPEERYPLPPRLVTMKVADAAGVKDEMSERERLELTLVAHLGMGTAMGLLYGAAGRHLPLPAPLAGAAFGAAVWAGNYLGLLPALGLMSPATRHPPRRAALMLAAHVVWGAATGALVVGLDRAD